jgi:hypothetical protein
MSGSASREQLINAVHRDPPGLNRPIGSDHAIEPDSIMNCAGIGPIGPQFMAVCNPTGTWRGVP